MNDLSEENIINNWFFLKDLEESTQEQYRQVFDKYSKFTKKSIKEIYESALQEEKSNVFLPEREYVHDITRYRAHLKKEGYATNTINIHMAALISFLRTYYIREPQIQYKKGAIGLEKNFGYLLSKEEILKMAEVSRSRDKAIIYMMALTGMSQKEMRDFQLKKFVNIISSELKKPIRTVNDLFDSEKYLENTILTLEILRKKVNYRYITFLPPEATRQIFAYLKERYHGRNKKIKFNSKFNGTLFVSVDGKPLQKSAVTRIFVEAGKRAGFEENHEKGSFRSWRSHGLRKYFISTIINEIRCHDEANFMAGHQISGQDLTYWRANFKKLKGVYLEALPYLSLENIKVKTLTTEDKERLEILEEKNQFYDDAKPLMEFLMEDPETQERFKKYMDQK